MALALDIIKKTPATKTVRFPIRHLSVRSQKHLWLHLRWAGNSKEFQAEMHNLSLRDVSEDEKARVHREAIARHLITGWENVLQDDGTPEPYTAEAGALILEACTDRPDILIELYALVRHGDNFLDPVELGKA